jgi:hypothetical protein
LAERKPIHWENVTTLVGAAILVGTELVGVSWAAGWALGGMFGLSPMISHAVEGLGILIGLALVYYFVRAALRHEPIRA